MEKSIIDLPASLEPSMEFLFWGLANRLRGCLDKMQRLADVACGKINN